MGKYLYYGLGDAAVTYSAQAPVETASPAYSAGNTGGVVPTAAGSIITTTSVFNDIMAWAKQNSGTLLLTAGGVVFFAVIIRKMVSWSKRKR